MFYVGSTDTLWIVTCQLAQRLKLIIPGLDSGFFNAFINDLDEKDRK